MKAHTHIYTAKKAFMFLLMVVFIITSATITTPTKTEEQITYLFIGNSLTFYNNMPEMYQNIVKNTEGQNINYETLTYGNRSLYTHYIAINAVIRTKGQSSMLTAMEKEAFGRGKTTEFNQTVFNEYKNVLLNADGTKKTFTHLVLQTASRRPWMGHKNWYQWEAGAIGITNILGTPQTKVLLYAPHAPFCTSLDQLKTEQDDIDLHAKQIKNALIETENCKAVKVAYAGRTLVNYLIRFGQNYAQQRFPSDYDVYYQGDRKSVSNDVIYGDSVHLTQLGSYIVAAALYSAMWKRNASASVAAYQADTSKKVMNIRWMQGGQNFAMENGPMESRAFLNQVDNLVFTTMLQQTLVLLNPLI